MSRTILILILSIFFGWFLACSNQDVSGGTKLPNEPLNAKVLTTDGKPVQAAKVIIYHLDSLDLTPLDSTIHYTDTSGGFRANYTDTGLTAMKIEQGSMYHLQIPITPELQHSSEDAISNIYVSAKQPAITTLWGDTCTQLSIPLWQTATLIQKSSKNNSAIDLIPGNYPLICQYSQATTSENKRLAGIFLRYQAQSQTLDTLLLPDLSLDTNLLSSDKSAIFQRQLSPEPPEHCISDEALCANSIVSFATDIDASPAFPTWSDSIAFPWDISEFASSELILPINVSDHNPDAIRAFSSTGTPLPIDLEMGANGEALVAWVKSPSTSPNENSIRLLVPTPLTKGYPQSKSVFAQETPTLVWHLGDENPSTNYRIRESVNDLHAWAGRGEEGFLPALTNGVFGNALAFDGVNDFAIVDHNPLLLPENNFTLSVWVKMHTLSNGTMQNLVMKKHESAEPWLSYMLGQQQHYTDSTESFVFAWINDQKEWFDSRISPAGGMLTKQWYYIAGVYQDNSIQLHIFSPDTVQSDTVATSGRLFASDFNLAMGATWNGGQQCHCDLDELRLRHQAIDFQTLQDEAHMGFSTD